MSASLPTQGDARFQNGDVIRERQRGAKEREVTAVWTDGRVDTIPAHGRKGRPTTISPHRLGAFDLVEGRST